jgi:hypothetical protein
MASRLYDRTRRIAGNPIYDKRPRRGAIIIGFERPVMHHSARPPVRRSVDQLPSRNDLSLSERLG